MKRFYGKDCRRRVGRHDEEGQKLRTGMMEKLFVILDEDVDGDKAHIHSTIYYAIRLTVRLPVDTTTLIPLCNGRGLHPSSVPF